MAKKKESQMGMNRTGAQMSPIDTQDMSDFAEVHSPTPDESNQGISDVRSDYTHEADQVGSVPLPGTAKGAVKAGMGKLTGKNPEVLIDKLGERLAFERTGVRLYDALMDKVAAMGKGSKLPFKLDDLQHNRDEELEHMKLCASALTSLGADPTAQTPSADVAGVASSGVMQVLTDPRTTVGQCLTAMLTAELTDNASWELLIQLTREAGQDDLLPEFEHALHREEEHAERVRNWLSDLVMEGA